MVRIAFILILFFTSSALGHESCCKYKLQELVEQKSEFIVDPSDDNVPSPIDAQGRQRWIPDPNDMKPDYWDDEDDGPWEPREILNPEYHWSPKMIRNPQYVPPPTYWDKLSVEGKAALPWVTLGIFLTGLLNFLLLVLPPTTDLFLMLKTNVGNNRFGAVFSAAILGLATPLCSCGALPLAASFMVTGIPISSTISFLTASQSAGLDSAAITWGLLGPLAVLCRLGGAIVLAAAVGMACGNTCSEKSLSSSQKSINDRVKSNNCCDQGKGSPSPTSMDEKTKENVELRDNSLFASAAQFWVSLSDTAIDILPTVFLGLALSTAALHYLPSLSKYSGDSFSVRLVLLLTATPIQLCEHTTVTLAAAIQKAGGSPGLAFAFLLAAPATNMPTLLLLLQYGGSMWTLGRVVMAINATALAMSYLVDAIGLDLLVDKDTNTHMAELPLWYVSMVPYAVAGLLCTGVYRQISNYSNSIKESPTKGGDCCAPAKAKCD